MDSRTAFEAAHTHLDLTTEKDAWGRDRYKHQCVDAMWSGWSAATERAAKVCEAMRTVRLPDPSPQDEDSERGFNAGLRRAAAAIRG